MHIAAAAAAAVRRALNLLLVDAVGCHAARGRPGVRFNTFLRGNDEFNASSRRSSSALLLGKYQLSVRRLTELSR